MVLNFDLKLGQIKKLVFRVTGLKILGRVGTHTFFSLFLPFKMHTIIFFPENLKKILGFISKFRYGRVTLNTCIVLFSFT